MNYELIKKLKEVGLEGKGYSAGYVGEERDICIPTLEELIEACMRKQEELGTTRNVNLIIYTGHSYADNGFTIESKKHISSKGSTPSEAVAKLYLALHEKTKDTQ